MMARRTGRRQLPYPPPPPPPGDTSEDSGCSGDTDEGVELLTAMRAPRPLSLAPPPPLPPPPLPTALADAVPAAIAAPPMAGGAAVGCASDAVLAPPDATRRRRAGPNGPSGGGGAAGMPPTSAPRRAPARGGREGEGDGREGEARPTNPFWRPRAVIAAAMTSTSKGGEGGGRADRHPPATARGQSRGEGQARASRRRRLASWLAVDVPSSPDW